MIEQIFIIAFLVLSIHYTMQPDEIFGKLGDWLEDYLPERIHPAVFACNVCMAPYYGSVLYWLIPWQHVLWQWPVVIIGTMGVNIIVNKWAPEKETKQVDGVDITKREMPEEAPKPPFENINLTRDSE
jgi:hypothetical protein